MSLFISFVYMKHEAWASFSKFSYKYRDKSAVADIGGYMRLFKWGDHGLAVGGDFVVWLGYDVGLIQLDPIYADYYVWFGGFKEANSGTWYLFVEHPCFHYIDRLDTLPLYWNAIRLMYRERDFEISAAQYIHSEKYQFLSRGTDWGTDLKVFKRLRKNLGKDISMFLDWYSFLALGRNYRSLYASLEVKGGLEFINENGDFTISLGFRPYERTGIIRDAEGVPYISLKVRGF
ncbi:MAG: hypothetical protein ABIL16_02800 [candidate division WOR-3 bacterium]